MKKDPIDPKRVKLSNHNDGKDYYVQKGKKNTKLMISQNK